ncbi:MAG: hypothetical protein ACOYMR_18580 [Ilumatobacteraceae bacterium]
MGPRRLLTTASLAATTVAFAAAMLFAADAAAAVPAPPPSSTVAVDPSNGLPAAQGPLVVPPAGCVSPAPPVAVFEGEIVAAVRDTARFQVGRVLAGSLEGYEVDGLVDVRYGEETRFLSIGAPYVVGAGAAAEDGALVSTVREPAPLFGGDAVVGANDSDVDCPLIAEPVRTLLPDGSSVDTSVLSPLRGNGPSILGAILRPLGAAFAVLLALVLIKHLVFAVGRSLRDLGEPAPVDRGRRHDVR